MPSDLSILFSDSTMRQSCARLSSSESNCVTNGTSLDGCVSASLDKMGHDADTATSTYVVEVTFQGVLSNAMNLVPRIAVLRREKRLNFLRLTQAHLVSESEVLAMNEQQPHRHNVWFPFHFDIPSTIYNRDNGLHLASCEETLPPSLHVTSDMIHRSADLYVRGECQISYHVRARITTAHGGCVAEAVHPVIFIPTHGSPPPLCVDDFPHEYTLYSSQNIYHLLPFHKRHLFIQTEEPPPLQFSCSETSFTTINLKLLCRYTTSSNNSIYTIRPPPDMFYIVQSTLQAATFSSVVPQHNLPKQGDIEPSQLAMVKTTVCPPQTRKLRFSPWTPIAENRGDQDPDVANFTVCGWQSSASLVFSHEVDDYFIPTFACAYASRRYSLSILVHIEGHQEVNFKLRVPLQVYYRRRGCQNTTSRSAGACQQLVNMPPIYTE